MPESFNNDIFYTVLKAYHDLENEEILQMKEICSRVFDKSDVFFIEEFYRKSPERNLNKVFMAKERKTDRIAGFVNLTDTPMDYYGINLKSCELSIVATSPEFQGYGINNRLTCDFMKEVERCGYTSIFIQGIPNFYRRYGFEYAVPMRTMVADCSTFTEQKYITGSETEFRTANTGDVDFIYNSNMSFRKAFPGIYRYRVPVVIKSSIEEYEADFTRKEYCILQNGNPEGYFCLNGSKDKILIEEVSQLDFTGYREVIRHAKKLRPGCDKIRLNLPKQSSMVTYLKSFEKKENDFSWGNYSFQVKIPDLYLFMSEIREILEKRIVGSCFTGEKIEFTLNDYSQCIRLSYANGRLRLDKQPWKLTWECNIPHQVLVKVVFGDSSARELQKIYPDTIIQPEFREFFEMLFPKTDTHFYSNY